MSVSISARAQEVIDGLKVSADDPGKREHAAVVRSTREAVDSYETITRRKP